MRISHTTLRSALLSFCCRCAPFHVSRYDLYQLSIFVSGRLVCSNFAGRHIPRKFMIFSERNGTEVSKMSSRVFAWMKNRHNTPSCSRTRNRQAARTKGYKLKSEKPAFHELFSPEDLSFIPFRSKKWKKKSTDILCSHEKIAFQLDG